jgi:hypothetical protein
MRGHSQARTTTRFTRGPEGMARIMMAAGATAALLVTAGCGAAGSVSGPSATGSLPAGATPNTTTSAGTNAPATTPPTGGTSSAPRSSTSRPSAADQLAGFFTAAARADQQERHAATLVNGGIGTTKIVFSPATVAAVRAIDTQSVARAIPGGLSPTLLRPLLQVYSDLAVRQAAFNRIFEYANDSPLPLSGRQAKEVITCLGNGNTPARWFATDLAAARTTAQGTPRVVLAPERSRLAAEAAIRAELIRGPNFCSAECGGFYSRSIQLYPITWKHTVLGPGSTWDGTVGTMLFTARYVTGQGWKVGFNAC